MTVTEILEQVKALSAPERAELMQRLLQMDAITSAVETSWDQTELDALLTVEPLTGREIVEAGLTGTWAEYDLPDGVTWVEEQRRKRRELSKW
jgi:hypothetical protein